jgi:molybdate transport system permease protein
LAFARSLGEFGAALILGGQVPGSTETVATALWTAIESGDQSAATRWALLLGLGAMVIHLGAIRGSRTGTGGWKR